VQVNKVFDQLRLPFAGGKLWVLGADGTSLVGVDPATAAATVRKLPVRCLQMFGSGSMLVATCRVDNVILRIDPASGAVIARRSIASPGFAVTSGTDMWVDTSEGVQRLDTGLRTTAVYPELVVGLGGDLAVDDTGAIWARQQSGFLLRIDPNRNAVVEQVTASPSLSGGSLLITGDSIWTTASDDAALLRLRR
jgi:streptogramin lyase